MSPRAVPCLLALLVLALLLTQQQPKEKSPSRSTPRLKTEHTLLSLPQQGNDPVIHAIKQGQAICLKFQDQERTFLFVPNTLLKPRFQWTIGENRASRVKAQTQTLSGWTHSNNSFAPPQRASLVQVGQQWLGTWISDHGRSTWSFAWQAGETTATVSQRTNHRRIPTLVDGVCRLQLAESESDVREEFLAQIAVAAQGGLEPASGEASRYLDPIPMTEDYARSLKNLDLTLVLDKEATGSNDPENLAIIASQWLATVSNVATIYENQLGIRLRLQELIMIPDDETFEDVPSNNGLTDFQRWLSTHRPRATYQWQAAVKVGQGLRPRNLGEAFVGTFGQSNAVALIRKDTGWSTLAHELGHTLGSQHTIGGLMNQAANDGGNRDFFTEVASSVGLTAAAQIHEESAAVFPDISPMRHPEEMPFAKNDYRAIPKGLTYTVDPRTNDLKQVRFGRKNAALSIASISRLLPPEAGEVRHDGGQIMFTPSAEFEGPVWFSYTLRGSVGNEGKGWLHKGDVTLLVGSLPNRDTLELTPGESRLLPFDSAFGEIQQARDAFIHRTRDSDQLLIRASADASGSDFFKVGSQTYQILYRPATFTTKPDTYVHHARDGALRIFPLLNDTPSSTSGSQVAPGLSIGSDTKANDTLIPPESLRLLSIENLTPDKGAVELIEAPIVQDAAADTVPSGEIRFLPDSDASGIARLRYTAMDPAGLQATEDITIHLSNNSQTLIDRNATAAYFIPRTPSDAAFWEELVFNDNSWTSGRLPLGYEDGRGYEEVIETELGRAMSGVNASIYVRIPFTVTDPSSVDRLVLRLRMDDGFIAYLNGKEVHRDNAPENENWFSEAIQGREADQFVDFDLSEARGLLREGENLLAIHGMNAQIDSSDFLLMPELISLSEPQITSILSPTSPSINIPADTGVLFKASEPVETSLGIAFEAPVQTHWEFVEFPEGSPLPNEHLPSGDLAVFFNRIGTYRIQLITKDALGLTTRETRVIHVGAPAPYDYEGDSLTLTAPTATESLTASLEAEIITSRPWLSPTLRWQQLSGPATATLSAPDSRQTDLSFLRTGRYRFRFIASLPELTVFRDTHVDVQAEQRSLVGKGSQSFYSFVDGESWTLPTFDHSTWQQGGFGLGFDLSGDFTPHIDTDLLREMQFAHSSVYVRYPFQLENARSVTELSLKLLADDGVVLYLNGREIHRQHAPFENLQASSIAVNPFDESLLDEPPVIDLTPYTGLLMQGDNVLAAHGLNRSLSSSDFLLAPELTAVIGRGDGLPLLDNHTSILDFALGANLPPNVTFMDGTLTIMFTCRQDLAMYGGRVQVETSDDLQHWHPWAPKMKSTQAMDARFVTKTWRGDVQQTHRWARLRIGF